MIPPEPRHFEEPWQAQAFALTLDLHSRGAFTWPEWAAALSRQRAGADDDGGADYYASWLAALEALVVAKGLAAKPDLDARAADWRRAYAATPHGKPVKLVEERRSVGV